MMAVESCSTIDESASLVFRQAFPDVEFWKIVCIQYAQGVGRNLYHNNVIEI
jgi:hypothetical protein